MFLKMIKNDLSGTKWSRWPSLYLSQWRLFWQLVPSITLQIWFSQCQNWRKEQRQLTFAQMHSGEFDQAENRSIFKKSV